MSHVRVKTTFLQQSDGFGSSEEITMYCHHNLSTDCTSFHYEDGSLVEMFFQKWASGKDKWDAVERLNFPFKNEWGKELKDGVEYTKFPWETLKENPAEKVDEKTAKEITKETIKKLGI